MNKIFIVIVIIFIIFNLLYGCREGYQGIDSNLMAKAKKMKDAAKLSEKDKKDMAGVASNLWAQVKEKRIKQGEGEPSQIEEEAMQKFLKALNTPGTEIAAPGAIQKHNGNSC